MSCSTCNISVSCANLTEDVNYCDKCDEKTELKPIFMMQMLVKDETSQTNKNFYRILLYSTTQDCGENFFGEDLTPSNLYRDEKKCKKIVQHLQTMLRFNVWINAVLERRGSFFLIRDTQIDTILDDGNFDEWEQEYEIKKWDI
jgi:hypothetical protein